MSSDTPITVSVLYPIAGAERFDLDYYMAPIFRSWRSAGGHLG